MRLLPLGALGLLGCMPAAIAPQQQASPPAPPPVAVAVPSPTPIAVQPPAASVIVTPQARAHARTAFAQALELWSESRLAEANAMVDLGLAALGRRLPEDAAPERIGSWLESTSKSPDETALVMGDAETLLVAEANTGRFMGLRVHDYAGSDPEPAVSPKASVLVAPSAATLLVYEAKGLNLRLRVPSRQNAPFAFVSEEQLVTVRLGKPSTLAPTSRSQLLQREITTAPQPPRGLHLPSEPAGDPGDAEFSDDEIVIVDLRSGKTEKTLQLSAPPDQGLLRKVASLPPSRYCTETDACQRYELDPSPIGRRVEELKVAAGMVVASWQGGATTFHRLHDGKLVGAFRSRGERWKPGLVAIWPKPPRAAVVTSLPNVGRGHEPPFSVTALFDFNQGRLLEILDECRWATGLAFSRDGKRLMVGDLRRACLHDGRSGRYLATTEEVRPAHGPEDDLQDVTIRPMPVGRWLLTTADGAYGVFDEDRGRALLRGKTDNSVGLVASDERSLFVADFSGGEGQLITFGPSGVQRRLLRMDELEQKKLPPELADSPEGRRAAVLEKVLQNSCLIEGFRLPLELCRVPGKTP